MTCAPARGDAVSVHGVANREEVNDSVTLADHERICRSGLAERQQTISRLLRSGRGFAGLRFIVGATGMRSSRLP